MLKVVQYGFNAQGGISSIVYVDPPSGGTSSVWGSITGEISTQADLQSRFGQYAVTSHTHSIYQVSSALSSAAFTVSSLYSISSHTHPSGSDPWTYLKQSNHFGTSNVAWADIPGLQFTPGAQSTYEFEGCLMLQTASTTINPMPGFRWPTGTTSVGWINQAQSATSDLLAYGNQISTVRLAAGGLPTSSGPWPCIYGGIINAFNVGSSFSLQLRSETASSFVSSLAGSFLKYRTI